MQGATHASEVPLTFYDLPGNGYTLNPSGGPNAKKILDMANVMTAMWTGFDNGNPSSVVANLDPSVPMWPKYELPDPRTFVFTINESLYAEPDTFRAPRHQLPDGFHDRVEESQLH